jgi:hypothetical protein
MQPIDSWEGEHLINGGRKKFFDLTQVEIAISIRNCIDIRPLDPIIYILRIMEYMNQ